MTTIHFCGQTWSGIEGGIAKSPGNPCDLFSRSNGSLHPKGHCFSSLSLESTELIIHIQNYNNQTTKGSNNKPEQSHLKITLRVKHV